MSLIVWNLQNEKKNKLLCIFFQKTRMCFNEPDYVLVHTVINIVTANDAKMRHKMLQQCFKAIIIWHLLEKGYYKHSMASVTVWLSCYVYAFAILSYLITVNQYLTIFFFQKLCVIGKISIRWDEKKHHTIENAKM